MRLFGLKDLLLDLLPAAPAAGPVAIESASVRACNSLTDSIVFKELPTV